MEGFVFVSASLESFAPPSDKKVNLSRPLLKWKALLLATYCMPLIQQV
jgi:hypothetical protein